MEDSFFAPAERDGPDELRSSSAALKAGNHWDMILDLVPNLCFIVNGKRQVVFSNKAALERLGLTEDEALGQRPGEILGCVHAHDAPGGCGTSPSCSVCGAVRAMLEALEGRRCQRECRVTAKRDAHIEALDLRVTAVPIAGADGPFALLTLEDIGDEKRRQVLEQLFFHDVLNSLASIQAAVTLINEEFGAEVRSHAFYTHLRAATDNLIDEVRQQREILTMEKGNLTASIEDADPAELLRELVAQSELAAWARGKEIQVETTSWAGSVATDPVLFRRVVGNMLKNALEASCEDEPVRLRLESTAEGLLLSVHNRAAMPAEVQLQVFQRSFSTKGKGRGLGTWSMKILAEEYLGGKVDFSSVEGEGTTFRLRLPKG